MVCLGESVCAYYKVLNKYSRRTHGFLRVRGLRFRAQTVDTGGYVDSRATPSAMRDRALVHARSFFVDFSFVWRRLGCVERVDESRERGWVGASVYNLN